MLILRLHQGYGGSMSDPYQGIPQNNDPGQWAQPVDPNWAPPSASATPSSLPPTGEKKSKKGRNLAIAVFVLLFVGGGIAGAVIALGQLTTTDPTKVDDWAIRLETSGSLESTDASGVMLDSSGYLYTAASAVMGATEIKAFLGDGSNSFPAEIVGVSECANVARLQFNGKLSGYTTLEWATALPSFADTALAVGFDESTSDFVVEEGIIGQANDSMIFHNLDIGPGLVGSPLVSESGKVFGINTEPGSAAPSAVVTEVRFGASDSIGFVATPSHDGLRVAGVEAGTPAAALGLRPGDIILAVDGAVLRTATEMVEYCTLVDGLAGTPYAIEVERDGRTLTGEMNGASLAAAGVEGDEGDARLLTYQTAVDETGALQFDVPSDWEIDGSPTDDGFPDLFAVGDEGYANMFFISTENPVEEEIQLTIDAWECTVLGASEPWDDGTYVGILQPYDCESDYYAIVVIAEDVYGERLLVDIGTLDTIHADEIRQSVLDTFASAS